MVRIKYRYLAVQILSPTLLPTTTKPPQAPPALSILPKQSVPPSNITNLHAPTTDQVDVRTLIRLIRSHLYTLFGDYGSALAGGEGLKMIYWSNATSTFVLRCRREMARLIWCAISFISTMPGVMTPKPGAGMQSGGGGKREVVMRVVRVSGTIKKALEAVMGRNRAMLGRIKGMESAIEGVEKGSGQEGVRELQDALGMGRGDVAVGRDREEESEADVEMGDVGNVMDGDEDGESGSEAG
ncbi:MAG: hypothetical protein Q9162_001143 [Coniocarpon cinnabarinum]